MAKRGTLAISDLSQLEDAIEAYFDSRMATRMVPVGKVDGEISYEREEYMKPPTISGLALALGIDRRTFLRYLNGEGTRSEELSQALSRARLRAAEWWEEALAVREASNGARFWLETSGEIGNEDEGGGTGEGFAVQVIPPAAGEQLKAIPKWEPEGDDDE